MTPLLIPASRAISLSEAFEKPWAAIVLIAVSMICLRRASSMKEGLD